MQNLLAITHNYQLLNYIGSWFCHPSKFHEYWSPSKIESLLSLLSSPSLKYTFHLQILYPYLSPFCFFTLPPKAITSAIEVPTLKPSSTSSSCFMIPPNTHLLDRNALSQILSSISVVGFKTSPFWLGLFNLQWANAQQNCTYLLLDSKALKLYIEKTLQLINYLITSH